MFVLIMLLLMFVLQIPLFFISAYVYSTYFVSIPACYFYTYYQEHFEEFLITKIIIQFGIGLLVVITFWLIRMWRFHRIDRYQHLSAKRQFLKLYHVASVIIFFPLFIIIPFTGSIANPVVKPIIYIYTAPFCFVCLCLSFLYYATKQQILKYINRFDRENNSDCILIVKHYWIGMFSQHLWRHILHERGHRFMNDSEPQLNISGHYILVPDYIAWFYRKQIVGQELYYLTSEDLWKKACHEKSKTMPKYFINQCKKVLMVSSEHHDVPFSNTQEKNIKLSIPEEKLQFLLESDDHFLSIIDKIEKNNISAKEKMALFEIANTYQGTEPGKIFYCQMVNKLTFDAVSDNEYFYSLLQAVVFMFHYQALADYEKNKSRYFNTRYFMNDKSTSITIGQTIREDCNASLGTYKDSIVHTEACDYCQNNKEYKESIKELVRMGAIGEPGFKKQPVLRGREAVTMLRNNITGHGSTAYSISSELVTCFTNIVIGLTYQFLSETESMMTSKNLSNGVAKTQKREDEIYLLSDILFEINKQTETEAEAIKTTEYTNYLNGKKIILGGKKLLVLNKKGGEST